jgi:hypothetical protein
MKNSQKFDRLCERLLGYTVSVDTQAQMSPSGVSFIEMCREEGLSEIVAENLFYAHFGLSSECLMTRVGMPKNLGIY